MILISHRGNIDGKLPELENSIDYIDNAIKLGYDVEIDVWMIEGVLFLGHDEPQYGISQHWLNKRYTKLWIHCKNIEAVEWFSDINGFNWFWHQNDDVTLTSFGYVWSHFNNEPPKNSIAVMPEIKNHNTNNCIGICSDFISKYS